jgi:hypothetical protein
LSERRTKSHRNSGSTGIVVRCKAMKSSPLLGPFDDSEFWGFSLLKIQIGWVL